MVVCFTSIKTAGPISERARAASLVTGVPTAIGVIALIIASLCIALTCIALS